jgi:anhydro-N-acetylmuramic acid kinase
MSKSFYSLGLMSGTSMDGIDVSIIKSDGEVKFNGVLNKYFEYSDDFHKNLISNRDKINNSEDLRIYTKELEVLEKEITLFHAKVINEVIKEIDFNIDIIGFHGQTIFHNADEKISKQLGDGSLLSQLVKKKVVYDFRQNDLRNGGQGAPLAPIFHKLISQKIKIDLPICMLNLGGIANITAIESDINSTLVSRDIGPGNCLIDEWMRKKTGKKFDKDGLTAKIGKINIAILNQALDNHESLKYKNILSYDPKDFDINFLRGLSLEDGASTVTEFTAAVLEDRIVDFISKLSDKSRKVLVCGGGRKNLTLMETIKKKLSKKHTIENIDSYGIDGDFIESQAFAYLAIRSFLKLPISFPNTTGCKEPSTGGILVENI